MNRSERIVRLATLGYLLLAGWVLLGRPDARVQLLAITRKTLRRIATGATKAAEATEDAMLDLATSRH